MGVYDLKQALRHIPDIESLTISLGANGNQVLTTNSRRAVVNPMASTEEIERALTNPWSAPSGETMSITGAQFTGSALKDKIATAKARMTKINSDVDGALGKLDTAATAAEGIVKTMEQEADALLADLGQFSNGGPVGT